MEQLLTRLHKKQVMYTTHRFAQDDTFYIQTVFENIFLQTSHCNTVSAETYVTKSATHVTYVVSQFSVLYLTITV